MLLQLLAFGESHVRDIRVRVKPPNFKAFGVSGNCACVCLSAPVSAQSAMTSFRRGKEKCEKLHRPTEPPENV